VTQLAAAIETDEPTCRPMESTMDLDDTARVRQPRDAVEHRLGTITDITYAPHSTDRAALVAAVTEGCRSLRDACRIAHDYDDELSAEIRFLLTSLVGTAQARLGVTIDPARLPESHGAVNPGGGQS
jgi:hypothetical protein